MPSSRSGLPSTIKVIGRGSKSVSDPLYDTRGSSKGAKSSRSSRGRSRSKTSSRHRDTRRASYEPPRTPVQENNVADVVRNINHGVANHDERRDDDDYRKKRSSSRDRRRSSRQAGYSSDRSRRSRSRGRSDRRKRRSDRSRSRGHYDDYENFEELDDEGDYAYSKMSNQDDVGGDPFNLCAGGEESFSDVEPPSRTQRTRREQQIAKGGLSPLANGIENAWSEDPYYQPRQDHSYVSIAVSALQLLVLMLQLAMCGIAPMDVNPMVGPYPDAFSEWGGKNAYLMLEENQYWRFITPAFLHVGVLHLLANTFCLLYSSALFEREWGSWTWLFIFIVSEVGCVGVSSVADPDTIGVGSSGALMGLFAAKLAHVLTYTFFETNDMSQDEGIHVDQLSSVLCGLTMVSLLSSFTYVDWSGHMGGLSSGFFAGILVFARPIRSCCYSFLWTLLGLAGLAGTGALVGYFLIYEADPDEELSDACEYFRNLFPEGYECGCLI